MPEDGYQGEYIRDIARDLVARHADALADAADLEVFRAPAEEAIFADIRQTCERLGIRFDVYTNELDLIRGGQVDAVIEGCASAALSPSTTARCGLRASRSDCPRIACWCARARHASRPIARPTSPII